jgi:hypothetical protein
LGAVAVLEEAGVAVGAAAFAGADFAAGVAALADEAAGAGAAALEAAGAVESAEAVFFELRDFLVVVAEPVAVFASAMAAASAVDFFDFEERFLGVDSAEFALSAAVVDSALPDFFERLLDFGLEEVSAAAESVAEESDFMVFDLDFDLEAAAAEESAALDDCVESSAAAFFFDLGFDFAALLSV